MIDFIVSNWVMRASILVLVFAIVAFGGLFLANFIAGRVATARGLRAIGETEAALTHEGLARDRRRTAWTRVIERIESSGLSLDDTRGSEIEKLLKSAGYTSPAAPRVYTLVRLVLIFALPAAFVVLSLLAGRQLSVFQLYLVCAILGLLGLYLPNVWVRLLASGRRTKIINGFPDSLDLMLVCVEAGLGLEASLDRVSREVATTHPLIAGLFSETVLLMRAGASRDDALRKLADSAGVDEIRSFTTLLIQSDKLGTSIATTLRVYASEMREARRLRAEERAHRLPVLISIPLVVFMLPTMIGVLALPAVVLTIREVFPSMAG
ncbi:type II secretion system F family protein [Erythrobacter sp. JK5]|uniref:type II secretion system F family protein n=1 Tax=Erythrobacter sp. JK5 TaxID=2829500 RepID=UPI001BADF20F|nr:type II secretion system F family protein [Erythrobacter sp. JK5]QUL38128.1 type II secretion system F family protein [Erythrobacter sp. JK5]